MTLELASTPTATLIESGVGCGKTAALIARVAALLEDGATPENMLVLAATPDAARVLGARLTEAAGERGNAIEVTCARDVALGLLASEEGRAFSGRAGRLVTPLELGFIMEDMKTSGLKQRRLREMLKFFYRNWTELAGGAEDDVNALEGIRAGKLHGNVLAAEPHGLADGPGRGERDELLDGKITLLETLEHLGSDDACSAEDCDYLACHGVVLSEYLDTLGYISES